MTTKGRVYLLVFTILGALAIYVAWLLVSAPTLVSQGGANSLVEQEVRLRMARVAHQLDAYRHDHGELPQDLDQAALGKITDPWGGPFHYKRSTDDEFVLFSAGPDGKANTKDDIRRDRSLMPTPTHKLWRRPTRRRFDRRRIDLSDPHRRATAPVPRRRE